MSGILYGIGVGPGDPELMTVKALRCIKESNVIILPSEPKEECYAYQTVKQVCPEIEEKEIVCLPFPMTKEKEVLKREHNRIFSKIWSYLENEKNVGFLTIGDSVVYSTYSYIHSRVQEAGAEAYYINGVPSFCAVAAALGISLGDNKDEIHIIPGSYEVSESMHLKGTRVYMKSGKKLQELLEKLKEQEESHFIYGVSDCGLPSQKIAHGIQEVKELNRYLTIVIVKEKFLAR
ncbi:MAG: precorrin-2 C(20)-methyltransferase [Roseburia sp.]